ncbi:MAG: T9SS type A sorting domain-containing protein [Bacteroidales bacterium]|nr:T9SS type A sorting domain-containing protein [Bacteroidales bacterium]
MNITLVTLLFIGYTGAQSVSLSLLSFAGGSFNNNSMSVDWSMGETVNKTFATSDLFITSGFQQPSAKNGETNVLLAADKDLNIYPNPVINTANIEFTSDVSIIQSLTIYNQLGVLVLEQSKVKVNQNKMQVNLEGLPKGHYFIKFQTENNTYLSKVIKL